MSQLDWEPARPGSGTPHAPVLLQRVDPISLKSFIPNGCIRDVDQLTISAVLDHVKACKLRASRVSPVDFLHMLDDVETLKSPSSGSFHWSFDIYTNEDRQAFLASAVSLSVLDMPTRITETTVVFQHDHFLVVRADESVPADFWVARVREDIYWRDRKKHFPVVWYISTSRDESVQGRYIPC